MLSLSEINGMITDEEFGIQFKGRVNDILGQSNIDIDLTSQFSSIDWVSEIIGEGILIQGSGVASGRLLGQSFEDLRLNDVQLEASTGLGAINAKGVISNIEIFSNILHFP